MSIISKTSWPSLIVLGMFNVVDSFFFYLSHFLRSNLVESLPVRFWNHKYHNRLFFKMVLPQLTNQIFIFFQDPVFFFHSTWLPLIVLPKFDQFYLPYFSLFTLFSFSFKARTFQCHLWSLKPALWNVSTVKPVSGNHSWDHSKLVILDRRSS